MRATPRPDAGDALQALVELGPLRVLEEHGLARPIECPEVLLQASQEWAHQAADGLRGGVASALLGHDHGDDLATAILDRLLQRSQVLNISGRSYRLRELEQTARSPRRP